MKQTNQKRRQILAAGTAAAATLGFPSVLRAQAGPLKVGVILPLHWLALDVLPFLAVAMGLGGLTYFAVYAALGGRELQMVMALLMPAQWSAKNKPLVISGTSSSRDRA